MKTAKKLVTRGFLVMALTLMAMTAIDMVGTGTVFGTKVAEAKQPTTSQTGKMKIPKNAKAAEKKAAKKLNKIKAVDSYTWNKGRLVQLHVLGNKVKFSHLKAFTGLTDLSITSVTWKNADFSAYKNLKTLFFIGNSSCKKINLTKNKKLTTLTIGASRLNKLDLSKNNKLTTLTIQAPRLNKLDLSKNKKLEKLNINDTPISKLDLSKNNNLKDLTLSKVPFSKLTLTKLKKLQSMQILFCNKMKTLSLNGLPALKDIIVTDNDNLTECSVSNCNKLNYVTVMSVKKLAKLNLTNCNKVNSVYIHSADKLANINVTKCPSLSLDKFDLTYYSSEKRPTISLDNKIYKYVEVEDEYYKWMAQN